MFGDLLVEVIDDVHAGLQVADFVAIAGTFRLFFLLGTVRYILWCTNWSTEWWWCGPILGEDTAPATLRQFSGVTPRVRYSPAQRENENTRDAY
jgi:hypothetical protein